MEAFFPEGDCVTQLWIGGQRSGDLIGLVRIEAAQHVFAGEDMELFRIFGDHGSRHLRSESNPRRIQLLTLPSGALMRSAISEWDIPSTKARRTQRCCSWSSNLRQRRSAAASAKAPIFSITSGSSGS